MSTLKNVVAGVLSAPRLGKATPFDVVINSDGTSPLYAAYLHGTTPHVGAASAGVPFTDLSGNGRSLTRVGSDGTNIGQTATGFRGTGSTYLKTPFTDGDISAAGVAGDLTLLNFGINPSLNAVAYARSSGGAAAGRVELNSGATYDVTASVRYGAGSVASALIGNPISSFRDTDLYMMGGAWSLSATSIAAYRGYRGALSSSGNTFVAATFPTIVAANQFSIGDRSANTPNTTETVCTLFYNRVLTPSEIQAAYDNARKIIIARVGFDV